MILSSGRWSEAELDGFIRQASLLRHTGEKVEFISRQFLGTAYRESTLIGTADTEEVLVINLEGVDCFTLLDYVEAMRISASFSDFKNNVGRVRYRNGRVSFLDRNHFFTDWREYGADRIDDITARVGGVKARNAVKMLNSREDGSYFLPGIEVKRREICFIPSDDLDGAIIGRLETGDYVGIYSRLEGLDVSHAGIVIKRGGSVYLRHASSAEGRRKVVDEDLLNYISSRPGLVVLRPKPDKPDRHPFP
jgi:N-acetylmuramoyl-L-alanine amidase-like